MSLEIQIRQAKEHQFQSTFNLVKIRGHVQSVRDLGNLVFLVLRDRSGTLQVVAEKKELVEQCRGVAQETPVIAIGKIESQIGRDGAIQETSELRLEELTILSSSRSVPPVEISKEKKMSTLSLQAMFDYRPLTLRNEKVRSIFKIEAEFCHAFRTYLRSQQFTEIHSPKIVSTGTEGGANLFAIEYFGRKAFLAQSPQFYKQIMVGAFERVFEIGPVYRAEEHDTTRHLNEYVSMDFEMGFIESVQDVIRMQVGLLRHMFAHVKETCAQEIELHGAYVPEITQIPQIRLAEAIELLQSKLNWKPDAQSETCDLDPEAERLLCQYFAEKEGIDLVYVTHYPLSARPFYAKRARLDESETGGRNGKHGGQELSASFDLLFRGLEITTGGQRIHEHSELVAAMEGRGLNPEAFGDYLQCFSYGMPPHGGLAIGLERLAKQLLGLATVKHASLFPRDINRLTP